MTAVTVRGFRYTVLPCFLCAMMILHCSQSRSRIYSSMLRYPADGNSGGVVTVDLSRGAKLAEMSGEKSSVRIISREKEGLAERIYFKSTRTPGEILFSTDDGAELRLTFYKIGSDIDNDGFPDVAELETEDDRAAFRGWFVRIAESQFLKPNRLWSDRERDCAGLIRYAYREALKTHDAQWQKRSGIIIDKNLPDVKAYHYPDVPVLGERFFKICEGSADDAATFGTFADAATLARLNSFVVSRDCADAKPGDILVFRIGDDSAFPFHTMIVAGIENGVVILIYHTGKDDLLKRVPSTYLSGSPYEPDAKNGHFIGVCRFNILE